MSDISVNSARTTASKETWSEDWLSVIIGVLVFALALFSLSGTDLFGWAVTTSVYTNISIALALVAKTYAGLDGVTALLLTYASLLVVLSVGVAALGADVRKFAISFTVVFTDRLCELDRRLLRLYRGGHAGRAAEIRRCLVAEADQ